MQVSDKIDVVAFGLNLSSV